MLLFGMIVFLISSSQAYRKNENTEERIIINAPIGDIEGVIMTSRLGQEFYAFRGIRYAKAPVGDLRFQPPVPVDKYVGVYNATIDGPICPQPSDNFVSEDCLMLNVYTKKLPSSEKNLSKLPVIISIHAGGFYSVGGASYWSGPHYFMDQDIVLVTINYRLGSLGFMSTGTKEAPGNNGLKDQVMAMRWVKENIASFGGDPESVTLQGYSAGSMSIFLHLVSPMSKGLFHKAIAMSGSPIGLWPHTSEQLVLAKKQARFVGCPDDTVENIMKCLKTKSAEEIGNTLEQFSEFGRYDPVMKWTPVVEPDFGQERFLTDDPAKLIKNGQFMNIPLITGITKNEFDQRAFTVYENETLLNEFDNNFEKYAPICFIYERDTNKSKLTSKTIRKVYFGDGYLTNESFESLEKLYSDSIIGFNVNTAAKLIAQNSQANVYYYLFSYQGRYSHFYLPGTTTPNGVAHHDDLIYLFYISKLFPLFNATDPEFEMVSKLTSVYANFAKTGKPTFEENGKRLDINWEPFDLESEKYLEIGKAIEMKEKLYDERYRVWRELYPLSSF